MSNSKLLPPKGAVRYWLDQNGGVSRGVVVYTVKTNRPLIRQVRGTKLRKPGFTRKPHAKLQVYGLNWPVWVSVDSLYSKRATLDVALKEASEIFG